MLSVRDRRDRRSARSRTRAGSAMAGVGPFHLVADRRPRILAGDTEPPRYGQPRTARGRGRRWRRREASGQEQPSVVDRPTRTGGKTKRTARCTLRTWYSARTHPWGSRDTCAALHPQRSTWHSHYYSATRTAKQEIARSTPKNLVTIGKYWHLTDNMAAAARPLDPKWGGEGGARASHARCGNARRALAPRKRWHIEGITRHIVAREAPRARIICIKMRLPVCAPQIIQRYSGINSRCHHCPRFMLDWRVSFMNLKVSIQTNLGA